MAEDFVTTNSRYLLLTSIVARNLEDPVALPIFSTILQITQYTPLNIRYKKI